MGVSGIKKAKIQESRKEQNMSKLWPQPPGTKNAHVYLRQDGEEVESNISSLIMESDMRLSRRGPAALPPIPCIIITEWRCRDAEMQRCGDAEMQGNIATLMSRVHWSTGPLPTLPAASITRTLVLSFKDYSDADCIDEGSIIAVCLS